MDTGLHVTPIAADDLVVVSSDPTVVDVDVTIERLARRPLVVYDAESGDRDPLRRQLADIAQQHGLRLRPHIVLGTLGGVSDWPHARERPVASYRFQLTPRFGFDHVAGTLDSLAALGVSHVYLSPITEAVPGSTHGYDVVDHSTVRSEFGGSHGLERLLDRCQAGGLRVIIDHVPNHVSVASPELNEPWWAMLRDGPASPAARWFDVDWDWSGGKVIVPRLDKPVDESLARGRIVIDRTREAPRLEIDDLVLPLARGTEDLEVGEALRSQHYDLRSWRDPARNVRRFFTIDDLVAVRVEHADVAYAVDTLPRQLCAHPAFGGVRVDHVDGLADPGSYLDGLRSTIGARWLLVEKILALDEQLPDDWPVDGTTGYEHVTFAEHTLLDPSAEAALHELWNSTTDGPGRFVDVEHAARRHVLEVGLRPDLERLVRTTERAAAAAGVEPPGAEAIVEITLALDRYRTYLGDGGGRHDDSESHAVLDQVLEVALDRLSGAPARGASRVDRLVRFVDLVRDDADVRIRWQQLTGPVMAKGAEDRAFYRWFPLASQCEVGGAPGAWTYDVDAFHRHQRQVQATQPTTMLSETTHDTKRSGAVRARSLALAARADDWSARVRAWFESEGTSADPVDVHLALQTAATAAPVTPDRLGDYLVKAAREAGMHTSWTDPSSDEAALRDLAHDVLADDATTQWAEALTSAGAPVGLAMLVLHLTCPGVPDFYQGGPLELTSLVDPDNRRPPDWDAWRDAIEQADHTSPATALAEGRVDLARVALTRRILAIRHRQPDTFGPDADYQPLEVSGSHAGDVVAFARSGPGAPAALVVAVRRVLAPGTDWSGTGIELPEGEWRCLMGDRSDPVSGLVAADPVVVLSR